MAADSLEEMKAQFMDRSEYSYEPWNYHAPICVIGTGEFPFCAPCCCASPMLCGFVKIEEPQFVLHIKPCCAPCFACCKMCSDCSFKCCKMCSDCMACKCCPCIAKCMECLSCLTCSCLCDGTCCKYCAKCCPCCPASCMSCSCSGPGPCCQTAGIDCLCCHLTTTTCCPRGAPLSMFCCTIEYIVEDQKNAITRTMPEEDALVPNAAAESSPQIE